MPSFNLALPLWLAATIMTVTASAVPNDVASQLTHSVPTAFNATAYNAFVNCVHNVSTKYHVAIEKGIIVVVPPENDFIDVDDADSGLIDCIVAASCYLHTAIDDSRDTVTSGSPSVPLSQATAAWAESHGAQGLTTMSMEAGTNVIQVVPDTTSMTKRASSYFYALGDDHDTGCANYDSQASVYKECINYNRGYKSIKFQNIDLHLNMVISLWPHHLCARDYPPNKKMRRVITVAPATVSACQNKDTFSWYGRQVSCGGVC